MKDADDEELEQENEYAEGRANKGREGEYERRDPATLICSRKESIY